MREGTGNLHLAQLPVDCWTRLAGATQPDHPVLTLGDLNDAAGSAGEEYAKLKTWMDLPVFSLQQGGGWTSAGYEGIRQRFQGSGSSVTDLEGYELAMFPKLRADAPFWAYNPVEPDQYNIFRAGGFELGVALLFEPILEDILPESVKHEASPSDLMAVVETRPSLEPVRIHLGRGKTDGYQKAWLGTRWDGFGTMDFVGSATEFELIYQTDFTQYSDEPLMVGDTPRGSFDYDESDEFTDAAKDASGWTSRKEYLTWWHVPRLRQILGGDVLVDISYISNYNKTIKFYWAHDAGSKDGKFYAPTAPPFKTIVLCNPTAPDAAAGLPQESHRLEIVENGSIYHELEAQYQYNPTPSADERPTQVTWILKKGASPAEAYSTRTVALPLFYSGYQPVHWMMTQVENGITTNIDLTCPNDLTPSDTDEPVLEQAVIASGGEPTRTIVWEYYGSGADYPGNWVPKRITCSGPASWALANAEFVFDTDGMRRSETTFINGKAHTVSHEWTDGLNRKDTWQLGGETYRTEEVTYMANLTKLKITMDGEDSYITYHPPGTPTPWLLKEIREPSDYVQSFRVVATANSTTKEILSGWGSTHRSGTQATILTNRQGGLMTSVLATIEGVPLAAAQGSNYTPWGVPHRVRDLRWATQDFDFFTGENGVRSYGLLKSITDSSENTISINDYDWLGRPTSMSAPFGETLTPDYNDPLREQVSSSAGYTAASAFTAFGTLTGFSRTATNPVMGSNLAANYTPGSGSVTVGTRQVELDVDPTGNVLGAKSGLGSRGSLVDIGVGEGMLYVQRTHRRQDDGSDFQVTTYYDARGRVRKITYPASSSSGSLAEETWDYDDAGRSVTHHPPAGSRVLKPVTRTVSSDGATLTVKEDGQDILRYRREIEESAVIIFTEKFDDSSGSGSVWVQVSRQTLSPHSGQITFTPWDLEANKVTIIRGPDSASSTVSVSGGSSQDTMTLSLDHGVANSLVGRAEGVQFSLDQVNQQFGRITGGSGSVAGKNVGFSLDGDGQVNALNGPGFNKLITYSGSPGYQVAVDDSAQGTSQVFTASPAGDFTGASGSGIQPLSQSTADQGGGVYYSTINGSLTATTAWTGDLVGKSYAGGINESYARNSDGSLASFGTGPTYATIEYGDLSRTTSYSGGITVVEEFYRAGPRKSVTGPADQREFTWKRDQLENESHLGGIWAGANVERHQNEHGLCDGVTFSGSGFGSHGIGFGHDAYARPGSVSSGGVSAQYIYDPASGQISTCGRGSVGTSWNYDSIGRVYDVTTSGGDETFHYTYGYDQRHRRHTRVASSGVSWFDLTYDDADRLRHVQLGNGTVLDYAYDGRGNRLSGGAAVTYTINALDQASALDASQRGYGVAGTVAPGAHVKVFHPLAPQGEEIGVDPATGAYSVFWSYGGTGGVERVEMLVRGTMAGGGSNGRDAVAEQQAWVVVPSTHEDFAYDDAGRMIGDGTWIYDWNGMNQLVGMTRRPSMIAADPAVLSESLSFTYDADGRRTSKTHTVTHQTGSPQVSTSKLLWDGWLPVMEERTVNGQAQPRRWFTWGRDLSGSLDGAGGIGGLVSIEEEGGRTLLPVEDGLGNITAVVNAATGQVVARYDYAPYGEDMGVSGEVDACPFRYQSKYCDAETGLYYFGYRYYSPRLGRWLSRDPLGEAGGLNLYAYCGNDPVNRHDYLGMDEVEETNYHGVAGEKFVWRLIKDLVTGQPIADGLGGLKARIYDGTDISDFWNWRHPWITFAGASGSGRDGSVPADWLAKNPRPARSQAQQDFIASNFGNNDPQRNLAAFQQGAKNAAWTVPVGQFVIGSMIPLGPEELLLSMAYQRVYNAAYWGLTRGGGAIARRLLGGAAGQEWRFYVSQLESPTADLMGGQLGGKLFPQERIPALVGYLGRRGIHLREGVNGSFDGVQKVMRLPGNPTILNVKHELSHYLDWKKYGNDYYKLFTPQERELMVLERLKNNRFWDELNEAERVWSLDYPWGR